MNLFFLFFFDRKNEFILPRMKSIMTTFALSRNDDQADSLEAHFFFVGEMKLSNSPFCFVYFPFSLFKC